MLAQQPVRQVNPDQSVSILGRSSIFQRGDLSAFNLESGRNFNIDSRSSFDAIGLFLFFFLRSKRIVINTRAKINLDNFSSFKVDIGGIIKAISD